MKMRIGEEMGALAEKAVVKHKNYYSCSAAVLCAFRDSVGISETEAKRAAAPFAGGRMGKCGAVLASEYVLKQLYGADSAEKITEFERQFIARDKGSVMCGELRGKVPGSCRACVTDAARILEDMISRQT